MTRLLHDNARPRLLVTGAGGQVGREFPRAAAAPRFQLILCDRSAIDIRDSAAIEKTIASVRPHAVVNAAAYTAVDRAESDRETCFAVNRDGARNLALACENAGIPLIHISTDYVFDGRKGAPYIETDPTAPLNVYGLSKAEGEMAVRAARRHIILRTSWIYGVYGNNFLKTMLRLGAERQELRIVDDQRACPTAARDLVAAILHVCEAVVRDGADVRGTFHCAGCGATSWFEFASTIFAIAARHGVRAPTLIPIPTRKYPLPARRPMNSALDCSAFGKQFRFTFPAWQESTALVLDELLSPTPAAVAHAGGRSEET